MADFVRIVEPAGHVHVVERRAAARSVRLEGLRPGILENQKQNARLLMESMVEGMRERIPLGELTVGSKTSSTPPRPKVIDLLQRQSDFLLVGTSD